MNHFNINKLKYADKNIFYVQSEIKIKMISLTSYTNHFYSRCIGKCITKCVTKHVSHVSNFVYA